MAQDATGAPTPNYGIPTFNTAVDAPSGKGSNAQMAFIDTLLTTFPNKPAGILSGETITWNGAAFVRSSVTQLGVASLADYPWTNADIAAGANIAVPKLAPGTNAQGITTTGGAAAWGPTPAAYDRATNNQIVRLGTTTNLSPIITGLSQTSDLVVGMHVTGTGMASGVTILTIDSATQVTLTANATASGTVSLTFEIDVQNTVTETTLYSKVISANDLSTNRMLRLTMLCDYLYNNATTDTLRLRVKFGGTTIVDTTSSATNGAIGAGRVPIELIVKLANQNATNSQYIQVLCPQIAGSTGASLGGIWTVTTGVGVGAATRGGMQLENTAAIDTTVNQTLAVTAQWSAASANDSLRMRYGTLELI